MVKHFVLSGLVFLFLCTGSEALDFNSSAYGSIAEYLQDTYFGIDSNAGLTAMPILNVPMGGKAEGMATSFAAVSDDASFLEWNPAGSSMLNHGELGFFHNNWIADTKLEGLVFASRHKDLGFAAGGKWLYTPFTQYNLFGERVSKGYYSEAEAILNVSYNFLSGYYFSGISVGINAKGAFRFVPDYSDSAGNPISGSGKSQSAVAFMADAGALTRFNFLKFYNSRERNTSVALVVRNLGPPVKGDALPAAATAAFSYKPIRPLLLSFDFSLPLNMTDLSLSEKPYWTVGFAVQVTSFLSMRAGFLTKPGNLRLALGSALEIEKISLDVNYTLDLVSQFTPLNRISLGFRFNLGDQGRKARNDRVDSLYLAGLDAYALGNYAEARQFWESALEENPGFDPAQEGLDNILRVMAVEERINEFQHLDF